MHHEIAVPPRAAYGSVWERQSWLGPATLESLEGVNEQVLALLRVQCRVAVDPAPWVRQVSELLLALDGPALRRAASCAVLLVDAGLADSFQWSDAIRGAVRDRADREPAAFFTTEGAMSLMRLVMTHAWHLARSEPAAARLLLGISGANATVIGACTLGRLIQLAESRTEWLRPRWENRPRIWLDLLRTAQHGGSGAVERMRVRVLQLLAADARQG